MFKELKIPHLKVLILSLIILILSPLLLLVSLPIYIYRYLVLKTFKFFKSDLNQMVAATSASFAIDNFFHEPKKNVLICLTIKGPLEIDRVRELFIKRVLKAQLPTGELVYPELKQYLQNWGGYSFWKDDTNFQLNNHVKYFPKKLVNLTQVELTEISEELVSKNWQPNKPLWEILIVSNCSLEWLKEEEGAHSLIFVRFHHCLGDGYSWFTLLFDKLFEGELKYPKALKYKRTLLQKLKYKLTFIFKSAYELANQSVIPFTPTPYARKRAVDNSHSTTSGSIAFDITDKVPLEKLNCIKSHFGVSFSSVLMALVSGATREMLIKQGQKIPKHCTAVHVLQSQRPSKFTLSNYLTGGNPNWPIGESDVIKRIKICSEEFERIRTATLPIATEFICWIFGLYPTALLTIFDKQLGNYVSNICGLSNFGAGSELMHFDGQLCTDVFLVPGNFQKASGVTYYAMSYSSSLRISLTIDRGSMKKDELKQLTSLVQNHLDQLYQYSSKL